MSAGATARAAPADSGSLWLVDSDGQEIAELPRIDGTLGPPSFDTRRFYAQTGGFAFDPGYGATASCRSAITFIDGENGVLLYRGYPVDGWPRNAGFSRSAICFCTASCRITTRSRNSSTPSRTTRCSTSRS